MRLVLPGVLFLAAVAGCLEQDAPDDEVPVTPTPPGPVDLVLVASGLSQPTLVTNTGDPADGLIVLEKPGTIQRIDADGTVSQMVDLGDRVGSDASEQGLLGLAYPPAFPIPPAVFVSYTDAAGSSVLSTMAAATDGTPEPATEQVLLTVAQPFANHNGGHIAFGPDGMLYYGLGDGGLAGDPNLNGQNPATLLGSMLRLDVLSNPGTAAAPADNPFVGDPLRADEAWATGLRNPWRFSFDSETGDLWIADVGQDAIEEIDFLPGPDMAAVGGANFGWNPYEGTLLYPAGIDAPLLADLFTFPVAQYGHDAGCSVTGGYVVRDPALSDSGLWSQYLFGDFCSGTIWSMDGPTSDMLVWKDSGLSISTFGEGADGGIYVVDFGGEVYRIAST